MSDEAPWGTTVEEAKIYENEGKRCLHTTKWGRAVDHGFVLDPASETLKKTFKCAAGYLDGIKH